MTLTYLGHSAIRFEVSNLNIYVDPYLRDPVDWTKLTPGHLVLYSHGHFDHGVLMAPMLWKHWGCQFIAPAPLAQWMKRKFRRRIPSEAILPLDHGQSLYYGEVKILAVPAHHPVNRMGKTLMTLFARSSSPGKPVNGYYFDGYYHAGATTYTREIERALSGLPVHTACLPIGGKYATASPMEALAIAEGISAKRLIPMHWQPLIDQVFFRYQPSDLIKLVKEKESSIEVCALAIGEELDFLPPKVILADETISPYGLE
ncbi:MAG: MBL fold metallo-hydrolase [Candidatus Obscuribacterales bacterium]|nr:MBL fold metallo-hydrolase [Candidatus Obscuribacterales bacterium]